MDEEGRGFLYKGGGFGAFLDSKWFIEVMGMGGLRLNATVSRARTPFRARRLLRKLGSD